VIRAALPRDTCRVASQENVEIARRALLAAFAQPPDLETVRELCDPALALTSNWGMEETRHRGVQGLLDGIAEMAAAFDPWRQDLERVLDAGNGRVVAFLRLSARESGVPVEFRWALVIALRDGRVAAARAFVDPDAALEAAAVAD
jgi:ketosteroid isomerase-like protein